MGKLQDNHVTIWNRGFLSVVIANIFISLSIFSTNAYVASYMSYLGTSAVLAGLIAGLYYGVAFLMRPVSGPAITILNKKMMMIAVYALGVVVNVGYAFFPTIPMFVVMRLLHGVQLAFYGSLALTVASEALPEEKMGSGLGVYGLSGIFAQAFGPGIAAFAQNWGTRLGGDGFGFSMIFLFAAGFALISVIPCFFLTNRPITEEDKKSLGVWYKNILAKEAVMPSTVMMLLAISAVLFMVYLIPYGEIMKIDNASLFFTMSAVFTVLARLFMGALTDKYGPGKIFYPSIVVFLSSFYVVSFAQDLTLILVSAALFGFGFGSLLPAVQVMVMQSVEPLRRGVASNTSFLGMDLGYFIGPILVGMVLEKYNYQIMFRLAIVPILIACVIFALGWKSYQKQHKRINPQLDAAIKELEQKINSEKRS